MAGGLCCWFVVLRRRRFRKEEAAQEEWQHTQEAQWAHMGQNAAEAKGAAAGAGAGAAAHTRAGVGARVMAAGSPTGSKGHPAANKRPPGLVNSRYSGGSSPRGTPGSPGQDAGAATAAPPGSGRGRSVLDTPSTQPAGGPKTVASAASARGVILETPEGPSAATELLTGQETESRPRHMHVAARVDPAAAGPWWGGRGERAATTPRSPGPPHLAKPLLVAPLQLQAPGIDWGEMEPPPIGTPTSSRHDHGIFDGHFDSSAGERARAPAPTDGASRSPGSPARAAANARRASLQLPNVTTLPDTWVGQPPPADSPQQQVRKGQRKQK